MKPHNITVNNLPPTKTFSQAFNYLDYQRQIWTEIQASRTALVTHPIYRQVNNLTAVQIFMRSHIFAVWDFMTLLKTWQNRLTSVNLPWLPPADLLAARSINEIVLAEETL